MLSRVGQQSSEKNRKIKDENWISKIIDIGRALTNMIWELFSKTKTISIRNNSTSIMSKYRNSHCFLSDLSHRWSNIKRWVSSS